MAAKKPQPEPVSVEEDDEAGYPRTVDPGVVDNPIPVRPVDPALPDGDVPTVAENDEDEDDDDDEDDEEEEDDEEDEDEDDDGPKGQ